MIRCYAIMIRIYYFLIITASHFNRKAKLWIDGRKNWELLLSQEVKKSENWIWFHCSSLGEFEDSCEVFFKMQKNNPLHKTILTVFSPSAFEVLKQSNLFDVITYLPIDTKYNAKTFIKILKPKIVLFSRSELWLNYLLEVQEKKIPIFLISLKLSKKSNFIKWPYKFFYKICFGTFNHIYCQNTETQKLLCSHFNISNSTITGNLRFERIIMQSEIKEIFPDMERFVRDNIVIVMGSCLPKDENIFLEIYDALKSLNIKWIIVPHEFEKSIIIKKMNSKNIILYSNLYGLNKFHDILIIDSVGILKHIYKYANFALIGGGFDKIGIHNIVEPSVYGVQTAFGPNHRNYEEAIQLMDLGGASIYKNSSELKELIKNKLLMPADIELAQKIKCFVKNNTASSSEIVNSISKKMKF